MLALLGWKQSCTPRGLTCASKLRASTCWLSERHARLLWESMRGTRVMHALEWVTAGVTRVTPVTSTTVSDPCSTSWRVTTHMRSTTPPSHAQAAFHTGSVLGMHT